MASLRVSTSFVTCSPFLFFLAAHIVKTFRTPAGSPFLDVFQCGRVETAKRALGVSPLSPTKVLMMLAKGFHGDQ